MVAQFVHIVRHESKCHSIKYVQGEAPTREIIFKSYFDKKMYMHVPRYAHVPTSSKCTYQPQVCSQTGINKGLQRSTYAHRG